MAENLKMVPIRTGTEVDATAELARLRRTQAARTTEARLAEAVYEMTQQATANGAKKVGQETIKWLTKPKPGEPSTGGTYKALQRALTNYKRIRSKVGVKVMLTAGDWLWDWIRTEQKAGRMGCAASRNIPGPGQGRPGWREAITMKTGSWWENYILVVKRAILRRSTDRTMERKAWRSVRQGTKQRVKGPHSADIFRAALWHLALYEGIDIEGQGEDPVVSGRWKEQDWWETIQGAVPEEDRQKLEELERHVMALAKTEGEAVDEERYMVHMFAGWGSGVETAAREMGLTPLAVEKEANRVSMGSVWVLLDLSKVSWRWWRQEIARLAGISLCQIECYWGGPPCTTFSKGDAGNKRDGKSFNYRDHETECRPPAHPEGSARGDLARRDDRLAGGLVKMYTGQPVPWALENPAGYLWRRQDMEQVNQMRQQVSYCAYWSSAERSEGNFQKHTHIWTSKLKWEPKGNTGTGRCVGHREHDNLQQTKSASCRSRVPEELVLEWLRTPTTMLI